MRYATIASAAVRSPDAPDVSAGSVRQTEAAVLRAALVDAVLGDDAVAATAATVIGAREGWPSVLALAAQWRVVPQLLERRGATGEHEADLRARMRAAAVGSALHSAHLLRICAWAQTLLARAAVPSVAIKGIATMGLLYGSASRRMLADVDLVIEEHGLPAARAALAAAGCEDRSPPFEQHVAAIGRSRYLHNYARTFVRDGDEIDLHWRFGPRPPAALASRRLVERSIDCRIDRVSIRTSGPLETALIAVHHALRNSFPAHSTLKDAVDLARWWRRYGATHGAALIATAHESDLATSLYAMTRPIAERDRYANIRDAIALLGASFSPPERREAERLRAFVESNLRGEAPENTTIELFAPSLFLRSLIAPLVARGVPAPSAPLVPTLAGRRPLGIRVGARLARTGKTLRDLSRLRRVASYRAVARAQSRFH